MGMSLWVEAVKPADDKWKEMKVIYDACVKAGVKVPDEVMNFFDGEIPEGAGVVIELSKHECLSDYDGNYKWGYEVDISKLPKDIKLLRFCHS